MPLSRYDRYFGGQKGAAAKAHAAMVEQYGPEKGERVFYATVNKAKAHVVGRRRRGGDGRED
ncbi:MAG TPA: hypothetical protein VNK50_13050 [Calidithermus sp.]|nr:hypothetical protein [Calidithermus sp.]